MKFLALTLSFMMVADYRALAEQPSDKIGVAPRTGEVSIGDPIKPPGSRTGAESERERAEREKRERLDKTGRSPSGAEDSPRFIYNQLSDPCALETHPEADPACSAYVCIHNHRCGL